MHLCQNDNMDCYDWIAALWWIYVFVNGINIEPLSIVSHPLNELCCTPYQHQINLNEKSIIALTEISPSFLVTKRLTEQCRLVKRQTDDGRHIYEQRYNTEL